MKDWTIGPDGWVSGKLFGFPVEKNEVKRPDGQPYLVLNENSKLANLHTSEGTDVDNLVNYLKSAGFAGQWCVGEGRIIQTRPLWAQGSLLLGGSATNHPMRMEVEQVAKSQYTPDTWLPADATFKPMAALAAFYKVEFDVPLKTPVPAWRDDGEDISPAFYGPNNRRTAAASIGLANLEGWIHHCEVPQNLHADCGSYNRAALFAAAQKHVDSLNPPPPPPGDDVTPIQDRMLRNIWFYLRGRALALGVNPPESPEDDPDAGEEGWAQETGLLDGIEVENVNPILDELGRSGSVEL